MHVDRAEVEESQHSRGRAHDLTEERKKTREAGISFKTRWGAGKDRGLRSRPITIKNDKKEHSSSHTERVGIQASDKALRVRQPGPKRGQNEFVGENIDGKNALALSINEIGGWQYNKNPAERKGARVASISKGGRKRGRGGPRKHKPS